MHTFQMQGKCRAIFIMDYSDDFEWGETNPKQKQLLHMASIAVTLFCRKGLDEAKMSLRKTKRKPQHTIYSYSSSCQI